MDKGFQLFPKQASSVAMQVDLLYLFLVAVTAFFTLLIAGLVIGLTIRYRRRSETEPPPPETVTNSKMEIAWSVIPLGICMVMFVWGAEVYVNMSEVPADAMEVHIMGRQWMWKAQHPDGRREINRLTVPMGRPVKLVMTSQDTLHSYYIPAFRVKQDVLPGRYSYMWFDATEPGEYHLFCAEYCGTQHSGMIGVVEVMKPADYQRWLASAPADEESPEVAGSKLFSQYSCIACHAQRGPTMAGLYGREDRPVMVDGRQTSVTANDDYLRESILYPRAKVAVDTAGAPYPSDLMPGYQGQLNEEQLMQLIAYIKVLGNPSGPGPGALRMDPGQKMQELLPSPPYKSSENSDPKNR